LIEQSDKFDKILYNGGQGILFKLDRIQQSLENAKDNKRWNTGTIISIVAILIALATLIFK